MRKYELLLLALGALSTLPACTDSTTLLVSDGEPDNPCEEDEVICKNGQLKTCIDGEWDVEPCENGCNKKGTACNAPEITKECDNGSIICLNDVMKKCVKGEWKRTPCENGCNDDATACNEDEETSKACDEGTFLCTNDVMKKCVDGDWENTPCENGCNDDANACKTKDCDDGDFICTNDILKTCVGGEWNETTCDNGCNEEATACKGVEPPQKDCEPGEITCTNSIKKICTDEGKYQQTECQYGCNDSKNDCAPKPEDPPQTKCSGTEVICENNTKKVCSNGSWTTTPCTNGCNTDKTDCAAPKVCDENAVTCKDNKLQKCQNNAWNNSEDCKYGCNKAGTACAKCKEGTTCKNGKLTTCKDDKSSEQTCQYGCDSSGTKCDEINQMQPTRYIMKTLHSPITPYVVEQMKKIKAKNGSRYDNVFIEIGDSHYDYDNFMVCYSKSSSYVVTLGNYANLQTVVDEFQKTKNSYGRDSLAAVGGSSTRNSLSGSPNLIAQEVSAMNPRFAMFGYGSNDIGNGSFTFRNYMYNSSAKADGYSWAIEDYYRQFTKAMDQLINAGIIPLISGIIPNFTAPSNINYLSSTNPPACQAKEYPRYVVQAFNAVSRGVAESRQIPWFDAYHAFYPLPDHGLSSDHIHGNSNGQYCDFSANGLKYGINNRNLQTVVMLDRAWRTVIKGEEATDPIEEPFRGKGTQADPYLITSIPYTHEGNTNNGEAKITLYSACSNTQEGGKEIYYKLELKEKKYVRMFAASASGVDVDIHVMKDKMDGANCIARADIMLHGSLEAGTYYIAVDTYDGSGADGPGKYLFGIVECDNQSNGGSSAFDYDVDSLCKSKALFNAAE